MFEMVSIRNLEVRRGSFVLRVPAYSAPPGQVIGVVGSNGAGKTTLLEAIAGLRPVTGGAVEVINRDPWREPEQVRLQVGFMNDIMPLFAMRMDKLLRLISGYYATWDTQLVEELLQRFRLDPSRKVHKLSRGQGVCLRLIIAMAHRPKLLILDEPAAGLDVAGRRNLLRTVMEFVREPDRTVIISTQVLSDIERIADRLLVLHDGNIIREGITSEITEDTQTLEEALSAWGIPE